MTQKALIIGGGIGGLTAALALVQQGWSVQVIERAEQFSEVGAGIQISPNGMKILKELGVVERLSAVWFEPEALEMRMGISGAQVFRLPMREMAEKRWGERYIQVHRADLADTLRETLLARQADAIALNAEVVGYEQTGDHISALLKTGERVVGDVLIGADGLHSVIKKQMHGVDKPRFTGNVAWRAVVPVDRLKKTPPPTGCIWVGAAKHAVTTRLRRGDLINFVGIVEKEAVSEEGWKVRGELDDVLHDFAGWNDVLQNVIKQADHHYRWALFDRAPLTSWSQGRATLLGDAAHPMLPSMAQGAVQAMEDAIVLAKQLSKTVTIERALDQFFSERIERTAKIQKISAANLRLFHRQSAFSQMLTYLPAKIVANVQPNLLHRRYDWIYGFEC